MSSPALDAAASSTPSPSYTGATYDPRELMLLIHAFLEGRSTFDSVEQAARTLCASLADQQLPATSVEMVLRGVLRSAASDSGIDFTSLPAQLVLWQIPRWISRAARGSTMPGMAVSGVVADGARVCDRR